jgi:VCBS repeat-containing protein
VCSSDLGAVVVSPNGSFTYSPAANYNGADSFSFTASDGSLIASGSVSITVMPVNDAPVAQNQNLATAEDTALAGQLVATDIDGDALTFALAAGASHGTVVVNPNGSFTYTPAANYFGADSFGFSASDGSLAAAGLVSITVTPVNDAPVAQNLAVTTAEDTTVAGQLVATDIDGDALTFALAAGASHGAVVVNPNGSFTYSPAANYNGADSFSFTASDGSTAAAGAVSITVTPVNDAPVAQNQNVTTAEDTTVAGQVVATDVDGNAVTFALATGASHGTVVVNPNGSFTYSPAPNYNGADSFSFTASDGSLAASGVVSLTVTPVNDAPVAQNQNLTTAEDTAVAGQLGASDIDGDALTFARASGPSHGTVVVNPNGSFTYTPALDYNGSDSFSFTASDGRAAGTGTVSLGVTSVIDPSTLSGRVLADGDGIAGVQITLTNSSNNVVAVKQTDAAGVFTFTNLNPGVYTVTEGPTPGYLQAANTVGSLGGTVAGDTITGIVVGEKQNGVGYQFNETFGSALSGLVWEDFNNDGEVDFGEQAIAGVTVQLSGTDASGHAVSLSAVTDEDGIYFFSALPASNATGYQLHEQQPAGFTDGIDVLGEVNGIPMGSLLPNDTMRGIVIAHGNSAGLNYNFGEIEAAEGRVICSGMTATIGFWNNKNGQALIKAVNGGQNATQLGNWLAATLPNMYGSLEGKTNAQVAAYYQTLFAGGKKCLLGPAKLEAQAMAVALATYVTNTTLAGTTATKYGFKVSEDGVGVRVINVGLAGVAFGVQNCTLQTVLTLLWATDDRSYNGTLYDIDHDGRADLCEAVLRTLADVVYTLINVLGEIG